MDTAISLTICASLLFSSATTVLVALFAGRSQARHRDDLREVTNFAINVARVYSNEFLSIGIRSSIPKINAQIEAIEESRGISRKEAVEKLVEELTNIPVGKMNLNG